MTLSRVLASLSTVRTQRSASRLLRAFGALRRGRSAPARCPDRGGCGIVERGQVVVDRGRRSLGDGLQLRPVVAHRPVPGGGVAQRVAVDVGLGETGTGSGCFPRPALWPRAHDGAGMSIAQALSPALRG